VEAVVGCKSSVAGSKPDDNFRREFGGFVVAVHRHGVPLLSRDDFILESGDSMLLLTTDSFISKYSRDSTFALIRLVADYKQRRHKYAPLCGTIALVLMIVLSQVLNEPQYGSITILKTALCGMIFMAMTGCASQIEMRCAIRIGWRGLLTCVLTRLCRSGAKIDLLIMIAVGFGLSEALTVSGGAKMVAGVSADVESSSLADAY
jgi:di/tricarboxylate transporter